MTTHKFSFTPSQRKKLLRIGDDNPVSLLLKPTQLQNGNSRLKVDKHTKNKIEKHIQQGKGLKVTFKKHQLTGKGIGLSVNVPKKLNVPQSASSSEPIEGEGAFASALATQAAPDIVSAAIEVGKDILGSIFGNGVTQMEDKLLDNALDVLKKPENRAKVKQAKNPSELKAIVDDIAKDTKSGEGMNGDGINWKKALLWTAAFLNPAGFITGPALVNAKIAKKVIDKVKGKGMDGEGIATL